MTGEIKNMLDALVKGFREESEDICKDAVDAIAEKYPPEDMDLDSFAPLISHDVLDRLHDQLAERYFPESRDNRGIKDLILNYTFVERIVKHMIVTIHDHPACSADCSRWIVKQYFEYLRSGKKVLPDMKITEDCYWKPNFGTAQQWMDLCTELLFLAHGRTAGFCAAYLALIMEGQG